MLSDAEWAQVAARVMHRTGLAPGGDDLGVRWVAVRHAADHIHIVATLARQDGSAAAGSGMTTTGSARPARRRNAGSGCGPLPRRIAPPRGAPTRAETEQAARRGWAEPARVTLRREVCTAAAGAGSEQEFFARLRAAGVLVRERHSTVNPDRGHRVRGRPARPHGPGRRGGLVRRREARRRPDPAETAAPAGPEQAAGHVPFSGAGVPAAAVRGALRTMVTQAAEQAADEAGFFARLREAGVLVRVRFSETDPGQVTGYSVTLPGHTGPDGTPLWYGGGRLAAGLTLPRLRDRWNRAPGGSGGTFRSAAVHCPGTGRDLPARGPPGQGRRGTHPPLRHDRSGRRGRRRVGGGRHAARRGAGAAQPAPALRRRLLRPRRPRPVRAACPGAATTATSCAAPPG